MNARFFQKVDIATVVVGLLIAGAFYFLTGISAAVSALAGCGVGMLNFIAQRWITGRMIDRRVQGSTDGLPVGTLLLFKYVGLAVLFWVALSAERIDDWGFMAGFLSYLVAVVAVGGMPKISSPSSSEDSFPAPESRVD